MVKYKRKDQYSPLAKYQSVGAQDAAKKIKAAPSSAEIEVSLRKLAAQECPSAMDILDTKKFGEAVAAHIEEAVIGNKKPLNVSDITPAEEKTATKEGNFVSWQSGPTKTITFTLPAGSSRSWRYVLLECLDAGIGLALIVPFTIFDTCVLWHLIPKLYEIVERDVLGGG